MYHLKKAFVLLKSFVLKIVGIVLMILGVLGLFLPVIPGTVLIFFGFALFHSKKIFHGARHAVHKVKHAGRHVRSYIKK